MSDPNKPAGDKKPTAAAASRGMSRRDFLARASAGAIAPMILPSGVLGLHGRLGANDRLVTGHIGVGGMGRAHLRFFAENVGAVCDVDDNHIAQVIEGLGREVPTYKDYRRLLERDDLDAVVIAAPDHWHGLMTVHACQAGKDVYVEKPMTLTIEEGRALADEAKRSGRKLQVGSHQRSVGPFRQAVILARTGKLGRLQRVEAGIYTGPSGGVAVEEPVPEGFDYEMWLGQAPWRPYSPAFTQGVRPWMYISDFSGGRPTEWGSHHFDIAQWGMDADATGPVEIEGTGVFPQEGLYDCLTTWRIEMRFADGVTMLSADETYIPQGVKFIGDEGWVFVNRDTIEAEPASLLELPVSADEAGIIESHDHAANWLDAIRTGGETVCNAEVGHRAATLCHLTNIAAKLGRKLQWDPAAERFIDAPDADAMISRTMRAPWSLDAV